MLMYALTAGDSSVARVRQIRPVTVEELEVIVRAMPEKRRAAVLPGSWCAMRIGEVRELGRKDVDLSRGVVQIARSVTWVSGRPLGGSATSDPAGAPPRGSPSTAASPNGARTSSRMPRGSPTPPKPPPSYPRKRQPAERHTPASACGPGIETTNTAGTP